MRSKTKQLSNRKKRSSMNTAIKKIALAIKLKKQDVILNTIKIIAKTAAKGIIHKKNAAHKISKIMSQYNK